MKKFTMINEGFSCENCGKEITKHPTGSARNHCPFCLYSKHLDEKYPGDRLSECFGLMLPVGIDFKKNKGNMIRHRCNKCSKEILNQVAPDDKFLDLVKKLNKLL
ncbi:MAG: RNHCP domain-containing protein [Candidatus Gracilibacteria bacterium]|nr:RNHCP domain-containing protein [Candidatus Gracilibacteria bacterium]MDQ7022703.1 RNHCP domain-containing protein [Candidatus Gracilibacteria bacterium]